MGSKQRRIRHSPFPLPICISLGRSSGLRVYLFEQGSGPRQAVQNRPYYFPGRTEDEQGMRVNCRCVLSGREDRQQLHSTRASTRMKRLVWAWLDAAIQTIKGFIFRTSMSFTLVYHINSVAFSFAEQTSSSQSCCQLSKIIVTFRHDAKRKRQIPSPPLPIGSASFNQIIDR